MITSLPAPDMPLPRMARICGNLELDVFYDYISYGWKQPIPHLIQNESGAIGGLLEIWFLQGQRCLLAQ
jgi:hypothetical protein